MIEMTVNEVLIRNPPALAPETPATEAARHLRRPEVPALVILDDDTITGIVTESDIVAMVAETDNQVLIREIMSSPVTVISPGATLSKAAEMMRSSGIKHLPVVDKSNYRGLLSAKTLAVYLSRSNLDIIWDGKPLRVSTVEGQKAPGTTTDSVDHSG
jgi:CBS domain-containing protein